MTVQFILGRSGTGKTHYCVHTITRALQTTQRHPLIFLVPEQATYQAERAVLSDPDIVGYDRLHILSFDRLHVQLGGRLTPQARLSGLARQMLLQRLLQTHAHELAVYGSCSHQPGLVHKVLDVIDQLDAAAQGPDSLTPHIARLEQDPAAGLTAAKLRDIQVLARAYTQYIEGRFTDPQVQACLAREAVPDHPMVQGAGLWIDGFSGFTRTELLMLRALLKAVDQVTIALCLDPAAVDRDPGTPDPLHLFAPTLATYDQLREMIDALHLPQQDPLCLTRTRRFDRSPALAHLEAALFTSAPSRGAAQGDIVVAAAPDQRSEVRYVARTIRDWVRTRQLRYRDIGVIVSDLGAYESLIHAYFSDYELPYFLDTQRPLVHHPGATLISAALRMARSGFDPDEMVAYMRTGLLPLESRALDHLENYCLAFGIHARDWQNSRAWAFDSPAGPLFDETAIHQTRRAVMEPLLALQQALADPTPGRDSLTGGQFVAAVRTFLQDLRVGCSIDALIDQAERTGQPAGADAHRQFRDWLSRILDECDQVLGTYHASAAFFSQVLTTAFSQMTMALIPPTLDQILVGSIERSRHPDLKAVFLMGVSQKQFPAALPGGGLLSDTDLQYAARAGLDLPGALWDDLTQQRYLAYIAFTRPSERLVITSPQADGQGRPVTRSPLVADVVTLYDDLPEARIPVEDDTVVQCPYELTDRLCRQGGPEDLAPWQDYFSDPFGTLSQAVQPGPDAALAPELAGQVFGPVLHTSATRLEAYAGCPFKHFARYVLDLEPRRELVMEPMDLGNFYHQVLELFVRDVIETGQDWMALTSERIRTSMDGIVGHLVERDRFLSRFVQHNPVNAYVVDSARTVLHDAVPEVVQMIQHSRFKPVMAEAVFGPDGSALGEVVLDLPGGRRVSLHGKVDRVDRVGRGSEARVVVFDYKRTARSPDWTRMYAGLDLQLLVYLVALRHVQALGRVQARSMGAFYLPVEVPVDKASLGDPVDRLQRFQRKARGLFDAGIAPDLDPEAQGESVYYNFFVTKATGEPMGHYERRGVLESPRFDLLLRFGRDTILDLSQAILDGRIDVQPFRLAGAVPCSTCPYRAVCRFDGQIHDYRELETRGKTEILEALEVQYG